MRVTDISYEIPVFREWLNQLKWCDVNIMQENTQVYKNIQAHSNKWAFLKDASLFENLHWNSSIDLKMEGVIKVPL